MTRIEADGRIAIQQTDDPETYTLTIDLGPSQFVMFGELSQFDLLAHAILRKVAISQQAEEAA